MRMYDRLMNRRCGSSSTLTIIILGCQSSLILIPFAGLGCLFVRDWSMYLFPDSHARMQRLQTVNGNWGTQGQVTKHDVSCDCVFGSAAQATTE